jgi:hypothetical protein
MPSCGVPGCKNNDRKGNRLFRFPKNKYDAPKWRDFLIKAGAKKISDLTYVCDCHFKFDKHGNRSKAPLFIKVPNKKVSS